MWSQLRPLTIPVRRVRCKARVGRSFLGPDAFVFGDADGSYVEDFRTAWEALLALAGITNPAKGLDGDLHWHDLRHECGSRLAERSVPLHEIQYLLGHASIVTTQRYLNVKALLRQMTRPEAPKPTSYGCWG